MRFSEPIEIVYLSSHISSKWNTSFQQENTDHRLLSQL